MTPTPAAPRLAPWSPDWSHRLLPADAQERLREAFDKSRDPACPRMTAVLLVDAAIARVMRDYPNHFRKEHVDHLPPFLQSLYFPTRT